jgi:hypothetical protein
MEVHGPTEQVKKFMSDVEGYGPFDQDSKSEIDLFDFNKIIPMPQEAKDNYNDIGYNWQLANWGCKWGADVHERVLEKKSKKKAIAFYRYDTPWCPANENFFRALGAMFPDLHFINRYCEPGMAFAGVSEVCGEDFSDVSIEFTKETFPEYFEDDEDEDEILNSPEVKALKEMGKFELHVIK